MNLIISIIYLANFPSRRHYFAQFVDTHRTYHSHLRMPRPVDNDLSRN